MPAREYREWREFYYLEPFGPWRDNWHSASIAAIVANANRTSGHQGYSQRDFMFEHPEDRRDREDSETLAFFESRVRN